MPTVVRTAEKMSSLQSICHCPAHGRAAFCLQDSSETTTKWTIQTYSSWRHRRVKCRTSRWEDSFSCCHQAYKQLIGVCLIQHPDCLHSQFAHTAGIVLLLVCPLVFLQWFSFECKFQYLVTTFILNMELVCAFLGTSGCSEWLIYSPYLWQLWWAKHRLNKSACFLLCRMFRTVCMTANALDL